MDVRQPPTFCEYAAGPCDQSFDGVERRRALFLYAREPAAISSTIEGGVEELKRRAPGQSWRTWRDLPVAGQIIFCEVCKGCRFAEYVFADVTTLNFNLMFELGFAIGLGLPVVPIRDTSFVRDKSAFEQLGALDTLGYTDFRNAGELADEVMKRIPVVPLAAPAVQLADPVFFVRSPHQTDGAVTLFSELKKCKLRFRTFDVQETARITLSQARRHVLSALGVVTHLVSPDRAGATVHNARCALVAGLAMATGKAVLMLQEGGDIRQPLDYRDVVFGYERPDQIRAPLETFIRSVVQKLQDVHRVPTKRPERLLEQIDLGDVAAENEIQGLRSYFVRTAQFNEARRGHARLVVGRKGSGKTAIFYGVRDSFYRSRAHIVLDLKPEGHQFVRLRETILSKLSPGVQEHTLTAFWQYILLCELAHKIVFSRHESSWARREGRTPRMPKELTRLERYTAVQRAYEPHLVARQGDLPERLLGQVDRLSAELEDRGEKDRITKMTELLYGQYIPPLRDAVWSYLEAKTAVWILVDNLDKGWPVAGCRSEDILVIKSLLSATRTLQRELADYDVELHSLVFLRNDIYDHLVAETADKGKETPVVLDWSDPDQLREMVRLRVVSEAPLDGPFATVWPQAFDTHVGTQDAFDYVLERTLMRPRDVLAFLQRSLEVALNRGHERVEQDDFKRGEVTYSEDQLEALIGEINDLFPGARDVLYEFLECPTVMTEPQIHDRLKGVMPNPEDRRRLLQLLVWYCFLGVRHPESGVERFAYQIRYNLKKLLAPVEQSSAPYVVHPVFRRALECH